MNDARPTGEERREDSPAHQRQEVGRAGNAPFSEWMVAAISTLLVLGMLGYTLNEALTRTDGPAQIVVRADSVLPVPGGHLVSFKLTNDGGETAAAVQVSGELLRDGVTVEESNATIDYVPVGAERRGSLQFRSDPSEYTLRLRVLGFDAP